MRFDDKLFDLLTNDAISKARLSVSSSRFTKAIGFSSLPPSSFLSDDLLALINEGGDGELSFRLVDAAGIIEGVGDLVLGGEGTTFNELSEGFERFCNKGIKE